MTYTFKEGESRAISAQLIGERIDTIIAERGVCHPEFLVDSARDANDPLHELFEWDDIEAARRYRVHQARSIIRIIRPQLADDDAPQSQAPSFVHVVIDGQNGYVRTENALTTDDLRKQVLRDAFRMLNGLRARYGHLRELSKLWTVLDEIEREGP